MLLETAKFLTEVRKSNRTEYCTKLLGVAATRLSELPAEVLRRPSAQPAHVALPPPLPFSTWLCLMLTAVKMSAQSWLHLTP